MEFSEHLNKANQELKSGRIGITIEQRGSKLVLRGTFPPKPNSVVTQAHPHQQRLSLGLPATLQGLSAAKAKAKEISGQLAFNSFKWEDYLSFNKEDYILSRQRKRLVLAYSCLAEKFKLDYDFGNLKGNYSPKEVNSRSLPDEFFFNKYCYPLYPEWPDLWNLKKGKAPNSTGKTNGDYGSRVTYAFYRYNIPLLNRMKVEFICQ